MSTEQLIAVEVFATHQGVEATFVHALHERGLVHITVVQEQHFLEPEQLARIEQLARLHYDLDINLEGLEAISHLLDRMDTVQQDLRMLRERLRLYEQDEE
ncbi:MAG: MerR family transcriptional regulator [Flavobacteriales bacterium]|nr:MerR family transcriptional regulator [Flavobacteriales bacterium]